jgi:ABC-type polysaccharide/polyol phosphate transport system ATPase subunit
LTNISMQCSLSSRVAVIGPNGAGKWIYKKNKNKKKLEYYNSSFIFS